MLNLKQFKIFLCLINCLGCIPKIWAADNVIDCSSSELVTSVFGDPIDLNFNGSIKIFENVSINTILSTSNNEFDVKYIDARLEDVNATITGNASRNLIIFTTANFQNYAKEQTAARISLKINLGCGQGKERIIVFFQPLKEANYFSPVFSQPLYELAMPTPIFVGFDLTDLLAISAKDDDLTNNQIKFTSNTSALHHISVGTQNVTSDDKKTYFAYLTLERVYLELTQQIEFVITATDNGVPPKSSNATVIIRSDPSRSLPALPRFEQKLYKGKINIDLSMDPIHVKLTNESYDPAVSFSLNGTELQGFEMVDNGNGAVTIKWNATGLNQTDIITHQEWELEVKAEHPKLAEFSVASVVVELADFRRYFHFMSQYYDGALNADGQLLITPIVFNPFIYKRDIKFTLLENPQKMFGVAHSGFRVEMLLMPNFKLDAFANNTYVKLALQASWEYLTAVTHIIIELPRQSTVSHQQQMLQFEKPLYVGNITEMHKLEMETIVLQTDVNATTQLIEFKLSGEWSHLFQIKVNGNQVKLEINSTKDYKNVSPLLLVLTASDSQKKAFTSLVVNTPQQGSLAEVANVFKKRLVVGKLMVNNDTQTLHVQPIDLTMAKNINDYEFNLQGNFSKYFELKTNFSSSNLLLALKDGLPNVTGLMNSFIMLSIKANFIGSKDVVDILVVIIKMPQKECPDALTPYPDLPIFANDNYVFNVFVNETGSLGFVNAYIKGINNTLHYMLEVDNDTLAQSLSVNPFTGELLLHRPMEVGKYIFNITAEYLETQIKARVQALLKVEAKPQCKILEGPTVEKTLVIKHIDEERPYYGLWNMSFNDNCTFYLTETWPKDREYVYINQTSQTLDIRPVDREDDIFKDLVEAEIIVKLVLRCGDEEISPNNNTSEPNLIANATQLSRKWENPHTDVIYSQNIDFSPDTMWLHLKIVDINDNAPQFKIANGPQYLGYPAGKVALDVYPEYLTKIEATDRDLGWNAKIYYSIRENAYFAIEPKTGKIYPKGRMLQPQQQVELIVLATDQEGQGLISGAVVIVKGLSPDFYSLITIRGNSTVPLEEASQQLSEEMGYEVKVIKMSYVPQMESRAAYGSDLICKAWIYAYRDQQLVECKELQGKFLEKSPIPNIVNIESYEEAGFQSNGNHNHQSSTVGYIVAVSLLSVISCSCIVFIIWRFYYCNGMESGYGTKGTLSSHECQLQQPQSVSSHHRGNGQSTESSNGGDSSSRVKFSATVENAHCDEKL